MAKDSQLRDYLEVYSLSSDQVFLSIQFQWMVFKVQWMDLLDFFVFKLYYLREFMLKVLIQIQKTLETS